MFRHRTASGHGQQDIKECTENGAACTINCARHCKMTPYASLTDIPRTAILSSLMDWFCVDDIQGFFNRTIFRLYTILLVWYISPFLEIHGMFQKTVEAC